MDRLSGRNKIKLKKRLVPVIVMELFVFQIFAAPVSSTNSISNELSSSPDDVTQLLSTLKQENNSLIPTTPLSSSLKKLEQEKKRQKEKYNVDWGMNYIPLWEYSSSGYPSENASGSTYQFFGTYKLKAFQQLKTTLGLKVEGNHRYSDVAPGNFAEEINSAILTTSGYRPYPLAVTELWVQQSLIPNVLAYRLGKIDLTSIMNSYAFDSRQFYFLSNVFTKHPATAVPSKSPGVVLGAALGTHFYTALGAVGLDGKDTTSGFSSFDQGKFFTALEVGYRDIITNPQSDNYHIFLWHVPDQPEKQQLSDQGISVVLQKNLFNKFIPFVKLDWSRGRVATFNKLFIAGFGLQHPFYGSIGLWGLGMGYAQLAEDATNQTILESFYRVQLTRHSQLTPNIQFIKTLPVNGHQPIATVWNLRYRIAG